jgi:multiple sugar transport system substrate-binding protein
MDAYNVKLVTAAAAPGRRPKVREGLIGALTDYDALRQGCTPPSSTSWKDPTTSPSPTRPPC